MKNSALLTQELIEDSFGPFRHAVEKLIKTSAERTVTPRIVACISVYFQHPGGEPSVPKIITPLWRTVVGEHNEARWPNPYDKFADKKGEISLLARMPSHMIQHEAPHLFRHGDFKFGGGDYWEGIAIGTSGLHWTDDFRVSSGLMAFIRGALFNAFEIEYQRKPYFIGMKE